MKRRPAGDLVAPIVKGRQRQAIDWPPRKRLHDVTPGPNTPLQAPTTSGHRTPVVI